MERIPTTEKLAQAMIEAKCPDSMIEKARAGFYDDFKSTIATPCIQLVNDLLYWPELRKRAMNGEFDAQKWEFDQWATDPKTIAELKADGSMSDEMLAVFGVGIKH